MHEATRRQYLALLGIEQWVPRDAVDDALLPVAAAPDGQPGTVYAAPAAPIAAPLAVTENALAASPSAVPVPAASAPVPPPAPPAATATPAAADTTRTATPRAPLAGERVGCCILPLADGLVIVAAFATPDAPGLAAPEHETLLRLAAALTPGRAPGEPDDFHWPPRGARVPGLDRPGEAARALAALFAGRLRDTRDLLVLDEALVPVLAEVAARPGVNCVPAPALSAMLADPQAKRACWERAKALVRPTP